MENQLSIGNTDIHQFYADFWEDKVYIGGRCFPAGNSIVELLNFHDADLFETRTGLDEIRDLVDELERGFVREEDVKAAKDALLERCQAVKKVPPFCYLDTEQYEAHWLDFLFRDMQYRDVKAYFELKREQADYLDPMELAMRLTQKERRILSNGRYLMERWDDTLQFYQWFYDDCLDIRWSAREFIKSLDGVKKFDESHLIGKAIENNRSGYGKFGIENEQRKRTSLRATRAGMEYISIQLQGKRGRNVTARRLYFTRALDFLITDFYEGIHNGHYPKQCAVCGKFFLVEDGRNQKYCDGVDPNDPKGRTCRRVAADRKRHEREVAKAHPVKKRCITRLNSINQHKYRGKITPEFAAAAKCIAQDCRDRALADPQYAKTQYKKDMTQEAIYAATEARLQR